MFLWVCGNFKCCNPSICFFLIEAPPAVSQEESMSSSPYMIVNIDASNGGGQGKAPVVASTVALDSIDEQQLPQDMGVMTEPTLEFDIQPSIDRIPGSSYSSEDRTTFSWVNVTGMYCRWSSSKTFPQNSRHLHKRTKDFGPIRSA